MCTNTFDRTSHVCVRACTVATHSLSKICTSATWSSLMATQESEGKPLSMGTKNWIQPDQCATKDIMQIRLKMLANMWAKSANWKGIQNILGFLDFSTCSSLMATQELLGNPCSMGTKNWRQPDQWAMRNITQTRLKILMKTPKELKNWRF